MKKEILRINNLNLEYSTVDKLVNNSICLLGGECVGFLGLQNSGKNLLVDIICGKHEISKYSYYIDGVRHIHTGDLKDYVYKITASNYIIDDWTVAEYLFLVENISPTVNRNKLNEKATTLIQEFGIYLNADKIIKKLTELEKRAVDLLKAYSRKTKIIVIEDEFEGCSTQDIQQFKLLLNQILNHDMAVVINSHSDNVSFIMSDKYLIFKDGYIIKKCRKSYIEDFNHLETLLLGSDRQSYKQSRGICAKETISDEKIVMSVRNISLSQYKKIHLDFYEGEVVTLIALDVKTKTHIFELLSGRYIDKAMKVEIDGKPCISKDISDFVRNRITSIGDMGGESELLLNMSVGDNLYIPSLKKIPISQHVIMENRVVRMLENQFTKNKSIKQENLKYMTVNDYIALLLERWFIFKPKVLILFEPFTRCDLYGISLIKIYLRKFTEIGTTVIIIKSREENALEISDRIISIPSFNEAME